VFNEEVGQGNKGLRTYADFLSVDDCNNKKIKKVSNSLKDVVKRFWTSFVNMSPLTVSTLQFSVQSGVFELSVVISTSCQMSPE